MKSRSKKIRIIKDGPYEVDGGIPLDQSSIQCDADGMADHWAKGKEYDLPEGSPYYLCRCGQSAEKPFCDGSHARAGFRGEEHNDRPGYLENATLREGPELNLLDDKSLCVGARFCDKGRTIWRDIRKTDDPEMRARVIKEACSCPGGRLTVTDSRGRRYEPDLPQEISLVQDPQNDWKGPLWVKGGIPIEGSDGEEYEIRNRVALCRCGETRNAPYCDGSHYGCRGMSGLDE